MAESVVQGLPEPSLEATARLETMDWAKRSSRVWYLDTSIANAASSPARRPSSKAMSGSATAVHPYCQGRPAAARAK